MMADPPLRILPLPDLGGIDVARSVDAGVHYPRDIEATFYISAIEAGAIRAIHRARVHLMAAGSVGTFWPEEVRNSDPAERAGAWTARGFYPRAESVATVASDLAGLGPLAAHAPPSVLSHGRAPVLASAARITAEAAGAEPGARLEAERPGSGRSVGGSPAERPPSPAIPSPKPLIRHDRRASGQRGRSFPPLLTLSLAGALCRSLSSPLSLKEESIARPARSPVGLMVQGVRTGDPELWHRPCSPAQRSASLAPGSRATASRGRCVARSAGRR